MAFFDTGAWDRAARHNQAAIDQYGNTQAFTAGQNAYDTMDKQGQGAEEKALSQLQGIASNNGLDTQSVAKIQQAQQLGAQQTGANTDAALNEAAASGTSNSGRALAARVQAGQQATQANATAGAEAAGDSADRALQAIQGGATIGGNIQSENMAGANAANAISQFNAQQNQQANQFQVGGTAAAEQQLANMNSQRATGNEQEVTSLANSAISGAASAAKMSDARAKENIERLPVEALPGVPFATWTWKPGFEAEGTPVGVIAQDLQKVAPQYVHQGADGLLRVDYSFIGRK